MGYKGGYFPIAFAGCLHDTEFQTRFILRNFNYDILYLAYLEMEKFFKTTNRKPKLAIFAIKKDNTSRRISLTNSAS